MLDARCTIQWQVWISRLNPSMNSNSSIHSNCCANSSSSSLSCRLDRGCSIATGIIVEYASVRSPAVTSALQKSFHESSRYFVSTQSTVHCLHQNGSIIFPSSGSEVSKDCASYQQLFNKYVIQSWNIGWFLILITRWLFREIRSDLIWSHFISSDLIWFLFFSTRSKAYSIRVRPVGPVWQACWIHCKLERYDVDINKLN